MHKHLSSAPAADPSQQHCLKSSFGIANRHVPQQPAAGSSFDRQQHAARGNSSSGGGSGAAGSGTSTPNSLYGFTPVSPDASAGDDVIAQAWESVEQFYSTSNQQMQQPSGSSRQQHYPAIPGAAPKSNGSGNRPNQRQVGATETVAAAAGAGINAAAAVQFAAGVSLAPGTTGHRPHAADAEAAPGTLPVSRTLPAAAAASGKNSNRTSQQQQQQQWTQADAADAAAGAFGVKLSGSIMATMGGWVVNQAITAAATTATAAFLNSTAEPPVAENHTQHRPAAAAAPTASPPAAMAAEQRGLPAAAAGAQGSGECLGDVGGTSSSSSWWRRLSPRSAGGSAAAAAAEGTKKPSSGLKSGLKAAAKRHGLRKKASVAAATAAVGPQASGGVLEEEGLDSGSISGSDGFGSEGSAEYARVLAEMDRELLGAASAGAAAAVTAAAGSDARLSAGGVVGTDDEEDEGFGADDDEDYGSQGGSGWLGALGIYRASMGGSAAAAARRGSSSGGGGGYLMVERGGSRSLAYRAGLLRGLLLWRNWGASAKALGVGLYMILLLGSIPRALHYMQVTTVLPGLALLYLAYNMIKPWAIRLYCSLRSQQPAQAARLQAKLTAAEEAGAKAVVRFAARTAVEAGGWLLAVLALAHRALRARRFTTSCWTVVALWLLLLVSELRVINQTLLVMLAYAGLFCVPWLYQQFRSHIDTVVYDTIQFLMLLLLSAERWAYAVAALAAAITWEMLQPAAADGSGPGVVVRGTAAGMAGLAVLLWRVMVAA